MRKIFSTLLVAVALMVAMPSQAQIDWGLKGGLNLTELNVGNGLDELASNKNGFFVGPMAKFTLPIVGIGIQAAALYDQRDAEFTSVDGTFNKHTISQRSIVIPVNLRWTFGLSSLASVHVAAGPQFCYNIGGKEFSLSGSNADRYCMKKASTSLNIGAGATVFSHLEVGVTYNLALNKSADYEIWDSTTNTWQQAAKVKSNAWQVHIGYWF